MPEDVYALALAPLVAVRLHPNLPNEKIVGFGAGRTADAEPLLNWLEMEASGLSQYRIGESVFRYAMSDRSVRAFVLFSLSSAVSRSVIRNLLTTNGLKIVYASDLKLNQVGEQNLIELCYGHNSWMTQKVLRRMTRERLGVKPRAHVVFFTGWEKSCLSVAELKARLRSEIPAHEFSRKLHGTDEHSDTMVLVEALTNPNTLDLINRVPISRSDPLFSRLPDTLKFNPDVCIDGSSVLELYGLRAARDVDLLVTNQRAKGKFLSVKFDSRNEKYKELPLGIPDLIESPFTTLRLFGYKFLSLRVRELLLSFEASSNSHPHLVRKARRDLRSIAYFYSGQGKIQLNLSVYLGTFFTRLRILFEFTLTKILPLLPSRLVDVMRKSWRFAFRGQK